MMVGTKLVISTLDKTQSYCEEVTVDRRITQGQLLQMVNERLPVVRRLLERDDEYYAYRLDPAGHYSGQIDFKH